MQLMEEKNTIKQELESRASLANNHILNYQIEWTCETEFVLASQS
jgi:hypothetical protein